MVKFVVFVAALALPGCKYGPSLGDCEVACTAETGCPDGFACGGEGFCRPSGVGVSCRELGDAAAVDDAIGGNVDAAVPGFTPSNLEPDDLVAGSRDIVLDTAAIDTDGESISGATLFPNEKRVQSQVSPAPAIWVVRVRNLQVNGTVTVTGSRALAIVASDSITIAGSITFTGVRVCAQAQNGDGAASGGGGGFGAVGGAGALGEGSTKVCSGGGVRGTSDLMPLLTGCAGANGIGGGFFAQAGSGGGALQFVAGSRIEITGSLCVPGEGGDSGGGFDHINGSGGGGSGGAILLEAPTVNIDGSAAMVANGGGGGGNHGPGFTGQAGGSSCVATSGGAGGTGGGSGAAGNGGDGGFAATPAQPGQTGAVNSTNYAGGGGGGVGRIRINRSDNGTPSGAVSPPPSLGTLMP